MVHYVRLFPAILWLVGAGALAPVAVRGQEPDGLAVAAALEQVFTQAIEQAEPSVVSIARIKEAPPRSVFLERQDFPMIGGNAARDNESDPENSEFIPNDFGAGVIVGVDGAGEPGPRKGYILTNYHVVKGGPVAGREQPGDLKLYVRLADRRGYYARIHGADPRSDLAVLVIDEAELKPIKFADPGKGFKKGQLVLALGNPYAIARDGSASVSWGMISNIGRQPELTAPRTPDSPSKEETIHHLGTLLQVDTRLNLGTSGGALVNMRGELIGITTSLAALAGYEKSVGFAVPMDVAMMRIINTLRQGLEVEYGFLGVQLIPETARATDRRLLRRAGQAGGTQVMTLPNSPAQQGGVQSGDIVLAVNEAPILSRRDLTREVGKLAPGEKARIRLWRASDDAVLNLEVRLGKWPVVNDEAIIAVRRRHDPWQGLVVDYATARQKWGDLSSPDPIYLTELLGAVLVLESLPQSRGALAEIEAGTFITRVNGRKVHTPDEFYQAVRQAKGTVSLTLLLREKPVLLPAL